MRPRLALFEPYTGGHHPEHLYHLATNWDESWGWLEIATPRKNAEAIGGLADLLRGNEERKVRLHAIPETTATGVSLLYEYHKRLRRYIEERPISHVLLMHIDRLQLSLALDLRFRKSVQLSGLLFRPNFHYSSFSTASTRLLEAARDFRKKILLKAVLKNPHLHTIFSLDPFCVPTLQTWSPRVHVRALPDPIPPFSESETSVQDSVTQEGRKTILLFGKLAARKGILQLLEACQQLPPPVATNLHLLLAGELQDDVREKAQLYITRIQERSPLSVTLVDQFIPYSDCYSYFQQADLILLPYQRHMGMSGILVRAAAARRPVLSQEYGLMGKMVTHHSLGWTADTSSPDAIADAICAWDQGLLKGFDKEAASEFAIQNQPGKYAEVIYKSLLD